MQGSCHDDSRRGAEWPGKAIPQPIHKAGLRRKTAQ
jgi:hypothetical protein